MRWRVTALYGVTVCAVAGDGVGIPEALPSFPKYPPNPNFVIPREVAESICACQRSSRRRQWPWHSTMDTATSRSMTALCGVTVYAVAGDGVGIPEALPSFPKYPPDPNFVIPREVAESIFACQGSSRGRQWPWHSTMDTATSRSMTVLYGVTVYAVAGDGVVWRDGVCGGG